MTQLASYKLFTPLTLAKGLTLSNRIVMSPMGRARADPETREPLELSEIYYEQRAGAGLIIAEATAISEVGFGWYGMPAMYNENHAAAWKRVTDRVHARGGKIFLQLWHMGRQGHSSFNNEAAVIAPSAIPVATGRIRNAKGEYVTYEVPRALETDEVPAIVDEYRKSAALAKQAGFDGVELHAANGYLIDQFLQSSTNVRTDKYGGSIENRAQFLFDVIEAVKTVWSSDRIGVRLSPNGLFSGMGSADNYEQFTYTAAELNKHDLAYVALLDGADFGQHDKGRLVTAFDIKRVYSGNLFVNTGYTRDTAEGALRSGVADAVCFGRLFITNPDLAERFQNDWPLHEMPSHEVMWEPKHGAEGYITFPSYSP